MHYMGFAGLAEDLKSSAGAAATATLDAAAAKAKATAAGGFASGREFYQSALGQRGSAGPSGITVRLVDTGKPMVLDTSAIAGRVVATGPAPSGGLGMGALGLGALAVGHLFAAKALRRARA